MSKSINFKTLKEIKSLRDDQYIIISEGNKVPKKVKKAVIKNK